MIRETKPALALFGASVFLFPQRPWRAELADAAHEVGARVTSPGSGSPYMLMLAP